MGNCNQAEKNQFFQQHFVRFRSRKCSSNNKITKLPGFVFYELLILAIQQREYNELPESQVARSESGGQGEFLLRTHM